MIHDILKMILSRTIFIDGELYPETLFPDEVRSLCFIEPEPDMIMVMKIN